MNDTTGSENTTTSYKSTWQGNVGFIFVIKMSRY